MKRVLYALMLTLILFSASHAQSEQETGEAKAKPAEMPALKLETNLVTLNVKVMDIGGRPLTELKREDFAVFENGEAQEVTFFEPVSAPINLFLLLDLSGSTDQKRKVLMQAAKKFIDALGKDDRIAVAAFTRKFYLLSDFTADRRLLKQRIEKAEDIHGGTAYYDSMWRVLDLLREVNEPRKAIVVLTDGVDNALFHRDSSNYYNTEHSFDELLARAEEEDATIYPIYLNTTTRQGSDSFLSRFRLFGIGGRNNGSGRPPSEAEVKRHEIARAQLAALAEATAGTLFKADREEDLDGVYQQVAAELHQFYSLAYTPKKDLRKGDNRKLSVKVSREGARVKTRRGYSVK